MDEIEPVKIKSYVILDLETTGLPSLQLKTKITEISLLCVDRSHISECYESNQFMPRVVHKLNLCVYPSKFISTGASETTGLSNDLLQHCKKFDEDVFYLLEKMIAILPPPVCIIAHNGIRFDFPILQSECNLIGKALADNIYCADTLPAFRELLNTIVTTNEEELSELETTICLDESDLGLSIPSDDVLYDTNLEKVVIEYPWDSESWDDALNLAAEEAEKEYIKEMKAIDFDVLRLNNERTPKAKKNLSKMLKGGKGEGCKNQKCTKKQLFADKSKPKNYRLGTCYEHLTGKQIVNAHRADSDTHALLECIVAIGPRFLEWVDYNCIPFNTIKKLW